ncbi:hypothetical protein M433DRAFT_74279 [Acidomyces richmondensis BFW]|nr:MAG: hypothetical protein FE78DRAFT_155836 [Acidomyces sp. 'richmondensis']KYG42209.1 hypothetical protein M433DRAFT_74279 [Acidomyces richmondensis BFW]
MSARFWQITGLAAAGGIGYYLYNAGGDPKLAQKKAEADGAKLSREVKSHLPGSGKEVQKDAEALQAQAGKKMDDLVADAKSGANKIDAKLEGYRKDAESAAKDARARASGAIDQFDRKVEEGASKAKSGISSWFGGSK